MMAQVPIDPGRSRRSKGGLETSLTFSRTSDGHRFPKLPSSNGAINRTVEVFFAPHKNAQCCCYCTVLLPLTPGSACNCVRNQQRTSLHPPFQLVFDLSSPNSTYSGPVMSCL
ncbi:hypothetical protein CDEST_02824 [Colletotrichum destructivum]|uniref:Uncharacterized protein n=1 Tax=Colletotrichum destructivum TaxID=34406 RepID=A0AAX4I3F8_9PEZI|nr:hypothetical protein CDEST_02824 [Colletotrichum destructivum]